MVWMQGRVNDGTEEGATRWRDILAVLNQPPARAVAAPRAAPVSQLSKARAIRAQAEAAVGDEFAAFQRYSGGG